MTPKFVTSMPEVSAATVSDAAQEYYQATGFMRVRNIITDEEADRFYHAALETSLRARNMGDGYANSAVFDQHVNVWRQDDNMRSLTLHPEVGRVAEVLAGVPLRLWHDHFLIKQPHKNASTEFHQDQPYWPHANSANPISCWIALCDVPVERGCMTFLPGTQRRDDLMAQNLGDARSLFSLAPDLEWTERITVPLRKGDCTFHHGRCAHMATPNMTDDPRVAHVIIFMDEAVTFTGRPNVGTDPLSLQIGVPLDQELFPRVSEYSTS